MAIIGTSIQEAGAWLRDGWPVGIPTETVYGLAANACDREALLRVFETKGRPLTDPLIVHLASQEELNRYAVDVPDTAYALLEAFSPGPLTLILPKASILPDEVSAGLKTAGFRIPRHPLTLELLRSLDFPLAAPSANLFGRTSPTTADHVADQLGEQIPYILDGGPCQIGVESTVLDLSGREPILLREGGLTAETLEAFLGKALQRPHRPAQVGQAQRAPGTLAHHYAPSVPLYLFSDDQELVDWLLQNKRLTLQTKPPTLLRFDKTLLDSTTQHWHQEILSSSGSLSEAAHRLFGALRRLEKEYSLILAQKVPNTGLGAAINDRLLRASLKPLH
ncbi:MAG: threonylcarbamoyl-AMP synthase [Cytophagia bacterium]|nr:threonylcarbamoyl-AMP synthase [Cytophagia bacterium]